MRKIYAKFYSTDQDAPNDYSCEGIKFHNIQTYSETPFLLRHEQYPDESIQTIKLFFKEEKDQPKFTAQLFPQPGHSLYEYRFFKLFYDNLRQKFRIPKKNDFSDMRYMVKKRAGDFMAIDQFRAKDGQYTRLLINVFESRHRNFILVYALNSTDFINTTPFDKIAENIEIFGDPI
jgi:hypothetical protein